MTETPASAQPGADEKLIRELATLRFLDEAGIELIDCPLAAAVGLLAAN